MSTPPTTTYSSKGETITCEVGTPTAANGGVVVIAYGSDGMIASNSSTLMRQS